MKLLIVLLISTSTLFGGVSLKSVKSPRSVGLGSSLKGNIGVNDILHDNPAAIAFTKSYTAEASYVNNARAGAKILDFTVVDSRTSKAAGGFAFSKITEFDRNAEHDAFYLAMAERYWRSTSLFIGGRYIKSKINEVKSNFYDFDIGTLTAFGPNLGLGLTFKNLKNSNEAMAPQEVSVGLQTAWKYFFPTGSITKKIRHGWTDTDKLSYSAGLEIVTFKQLFLRGGYNVDDEVNTSNYSLGTGWKAPKISFDYAYERGIEDANNYQHLASCRMYF